MCTRRQKGGCFGATRSDLGSSSSYCRTGGIVYLKFCSIHIIFKYKYKSQTNTGTKFRELLAWRPDVTKPRGPSRSGRRGYPPEVRKSTFLCCPGSQIQRKPERLPVSPFRTCRGDSRVSIGCENKTYRRRFPPDRVKYPGVWYLMSSIFESRSVSIRVKSAFSMGPLRSCERSDPGVVSI
jgi:hypothetical protein